MRYIEVIVEAAIPYLEKYRVFLSFFRCAQNDKKAIYGIAVVEVFKARNTEGSPQSRFSNSLALT
jgi:hypothetical protein